MVETHGNVPGFSRGPDLAGMYGVNEVLEIWATLLDAVEVGGGGHLSVHCRVSREPRLGEHT